MGQPDLRAGIRFGRESVRNHAHRRGQQRGNAVRTRQRRVHHHGARFVQFNYRKRPAGGPRDRCRGESFRHPRPRAASTTRAPYLPSRQAGTRSAAIASFDGTNGATPSGGLMIDSSGNLYGATASGGANQLRRCLRDPQVHRPAHAPGVVQRHRWLVAQRSVWWWMGTATSS